MPCRDGPVTFGYRSPFPPARTKVAKVVLFLVEIVTDPRAVSLSFCTSAGSRLFGPFAVPLPEAVPSPTVSTADTRAATAHVRCRENLMERS